MPVIYVDVLFATNFIIDIMLLWCSGKLAGLKIIKWRLVLGAIIGGIYSVCIFFPELSPLFLVFSKITVSAVLLAVSFNITRLKQFIRVLVAFYISNFILGGSIMGIMCFTNMGGGIDSILSNGSVYFNLPFGVLFLIALSVTVIVQLITKYFKKFLLKQGLICKITIIFNNKIVKLHGLFDTGNNLKDPITGKPVMVAELSAVEKLFPQEIVNNLENNDINFVYETADSFLSTRLRLIPYSAVGTEKGMLIAFKPDTTIIEKDSSAPICCDCIIAVCPGKLGNAKGYKIIVSPDTII